MLPTSFGFLLMFSVREETKMGVRPGMPTGNLGGVMLGLGAGVVEGASGWLSSSSSASSLESVLPRVLSLWRLALCLSFSLALKGLGLLKLRPEMMEGRLGFLAISEAEVGAMLLLRDERLGLMLLLLMLPLTLLLALLNTLEDASMEGLDCGRGELAGVAMRVGVTSLLVMMATVVRLRPLDLTGLALFLGLLKRLGRMTGVNVLLGLVKVSLPREEAEAGDSDEDSEAGLRTLEARVKSLSRSSRLRELEARLGVMVAGLSSNSTSPEAGESLSPDSNSGAAVGWTLEARLKA